MNLLKWLDDQREEDSMSDLYQSLSHSKWDCKYHVVLVPKRRRKAIFGQTRRQLGPIFHALAKQKECQIIEGHLMPDHVHMCITILPRGPELPGDPVVQDQFTAVCSCDPSIAARLLSPVVFQYGEESTGSLQ
jgi:hypothetical protein